MSEPLWQPSAERRTHANMTMFMREAERVSGRSFADYDALQRWSVDEPEAFWTLLWDFCGVVADTRGERVIVDGDRMPGARFFPDARLNFAENLLRLDAPGPALVFRGEDGRRREMSRAELRWEVSRCAQALDAAGIGPGDRVVGYLPNIPEAVVAVLAVTSLGAIWSSCSPDFGVNGVLDRFGQIEPTLLITVDGYLYAGKRIDIRPKVEEITLKLPSVERVVVVSFLEEAPNLAAIPRSVGWEELLERYTPGEIPFYRLPFDHPLYILYSSGTTGVPKCIVHSAGGALLMHLKEHVLHTDEKPGDRLFYFTTLGWMMWNWLVGGLSAGSTLMLYDGSPFHPGPETLWDYAAEEGFTIFGTSAKYIDAIAKAGIAPGETHDLSRLKAIVSTGSPLMPEGFDWVYDKVKRDLHLASVSGGTDLAGCFVAGNPIGPVRRGEIQVAALGMAVDVLDEDGRPVRQAKGELVCTRPFPSMPLGFWNDPSDEKYREAYYARFPNIWCHGDWAEWTAHGGMVIYGRSDATLNPGGVRIGTAEIYRQVEQLDEVVESIVVGQDWEGDVRVVLFVRLREGLTLDDALIDRIRRRIRENASPRHVPAKIVQVTDIPRTRSGKIVELAVREVVHGRPVKNIEALDNPAALDQFRDRSELGD